MEKLITCEICGTKMEYRYTVSNKYAYTGSCKKILFWCPICKKHVIKQRGFG